MDRSESADNQARKPRAAVVLESDSDGVFDAMSRLEEQKACEDIDYILLVSRDKQRILMFFRTEQDWASKVMTLNIG